MPSSLCLQLLVVSMDTVAELTGGSLAMPGLGGVTGGAPA